MQPAVTELVANKPNQQHKQQSARAKAIDLTKVVVVIVAGVAENNKKVNEEKVLVKVIPAQENNNNKLRLNLAQLSKPQHMKTKSKEL
jgi:hypothetical protein